MFFSSLAIWLIKNTNIFFGFLIFEFVVIIIYFSVYCIIYVRSIKGLVKSWEGLSVHKKRNIFIFFIGASLIAFGSWYFFALNVLDQPAPRIISSFGEWFFDLLVKIKILR